jgi:hypothetical protein
MHPTVPPRTRAPWSSSIGISGRHASERVVFFVGMPSPAPRRSGCRSSLRPHPICPPSRGSAPSSAARDKPLGSWLGNEAGLSLIGYGGIGYGGDNAVAKLRYILCRQAEGRGQTRFTCTRLSDIFHPMNSSQLIQHFDRVRSFGGLQQGVIP